MQAASVLASSSPQTPQFSLMASVDRLSPFEACLFRQADLFEGSRMLGITTRLVPLVHHPHSGQGRQAVCQHPCGQASDGRCEPR